MGVHITVPDIAGWITVVAYAAVVVIAFLRQWWGWGRSWKMYSRPHTLVSTYTPLEGESPTPNAVFCEEHWDKTLDALHAHPAPGRWLGHSFAVVVPAATGIWRWSYIIATSPGLRDPLGKWQWRRECARLAFTRRFEEPEIGGCPECLPVKAQDPSLARQLGTVTEI